MAAGGPQPFAGGSLKNLTLSPAASDLGFADMVVQQVQNTMQEKKKADGVDDDPLSPAVSTLFGKGMLLGNS
jgi:hypothetical protein